MDWITNKIYLVEKSIGRVDVYTADGANRTNLITSNLFRPTSIALDAVENFLFLADSGSPVNKLHKAKIERALMDGRSRQIIVKDKLLEPVALTVEPIKKRLYWLDKKYDHLETCDYYGSRRHIVAAGSDNLPHSLSLDIFENMIYFADATKLAIMRLKRHAISAEANITYHYKLVGGLKPKFLRAHHKSKQSAERLNPCAHNNAGCEHFCLLSNAEPQIGSSGSGTGASGAASFRCKCKLGYQLRRDMRSCHRVDEYLLMSQANVIRGISVDSNAHTETRTPIIVPRSGYARAIELDYRANLTFYYDSLRKAIFQNKYAGNGSADESASTPLVPDNLFYVENMAYDWVSKNLYFTNVGKVTCVQVDRPQGRRDLIKMSQVFGLALDPNSGYLFFSSVSRPAKIYRSYLDGTNFTIVQQRSLSLPYSLSVDLTSKKLYWADSHLAKIQYSNYDGSNVVTLMSTGLAMPTSIVVYKYNLFFLDSRLSNVYKTSKYYSISPSVLRANVNNLHQIRIYSQDAQPVTDNHPCARQNGDCSHFCFAVPATAAGAAADEQYRLARHCGCPYGYKLDINMATCVNNPEEPAVPQCASTNLFKCNNNRCVRQACFCLKIISSTIALTLLYSFVYSCSSSLGKWTSATASTTVLTLLTSLTAQVSVSCLATLFV
jgi:low density lipoprotein-related protein 2